MSRKGVAAGPPMNNGMQNREAWLEAAVTRLRPLLTEAQCIIPEKVRAAIGFTGTGRKGQKRGEVWRPERSQGGYAEFFIRPDMDDALDIVTLLSSLLVELAVPPGQGFGARYKVAAARVGLRGTRSDPHCTPGLRDQLVAIITELGPIPHDRLDIGLVVRRKQSTRLLGAACPACHARIRLTRTTCDEAGLPICARDNRQFILDEKRTAAPEAGSATAPASRKAPVAETPTGPQLGPTWTVRFQAPPPREITARLRELGGSYASATQQWHGRDNADAVRALATEAGGEFATQDTERHAA